MITSIKSTVSGMEVSLHNPDNWKQFYPQTEMIVMKKGRLLFPHLNYILKGLNPDELYGVFIHFERVDNNKYQFFHNKWNVLGKGDEVRPAKVEQHKDGWRTGSYWMTTPVSFEHIKITNDPNLNKSNTFPLQSLHKFLPVIGIQKMGDSRIEGFRLNVTEFMAVTTYQSSDIIALKTKLNKFAHGKDLSSGLAKRGTKRPATSRAELPSPPSSASSVSPSPLPSETVSPKESPPYTRLPSIESMWSSAGHSGFHAPRTASTPGNVPTTSTQTIAYPYWTPENVQVPMKNEYPSGQMPMHQMNKNSWYPMNMHQGMGHGMVPVIGKDMSPETPIGMASQTPNILYGNFPSKAGNNQEEMSVLANSGSWNTKKDMQNLESPYYQ